MTGSIETESEIYIQKEHTDRFYQVGEKLAFLKMPSSWPEKPERVTVEETHLSCVFLTGTYAWKLKKPINCDPFLDFSTLEKREYFCREELRLNCRLAPDVYLDVVPLTQNKYGVFAVGGDEKVIDWLVKMKQLPRDMTFRAALENNTLDNEDIESVAKKLIRFFDTAERTKISSENYIRWLGDTIHYNFSRLLDAEHDARYMRLIKNLKDRQLSFLEQGKNLLQQRVQDRKIIEGHGDLRPEHIYLLTPEPVIIDCIEFNHNLRQADMADELSFLQMMCASFGNEDAGKQVFDIYRRETGDRPPAALTSFYAGFRAVMRARLALRHLQDMPDSDPVKWNRKLQQFLDLAQMYGERQEDSL